MTNQSPVFKDGYKNIFLDNIILHWKRMCNVVLQYMNSVLQRTEWKTLLTSSSSGHSTLTNTNYTPCCPNVFIQRLSTLVFFVSERRNVLTAASTNTQWLLPFLTKTGSKHGTVDLLNQGGMMTSRAELKYLEKNLPPCYYVHVDCCGTEPGPPEWEAGTYPSELWDVLCLLVDLL